MDKGKLAVGVPPEELDAIFGADLPELEQIRQAFDRITAFVVAYGQNEVELARAMQDREGVIKTQIKMSTVAWAREVFDTCYRRATGRRAWEE